MSDECKDEVRMNHTEKIAKLESSVSSAHHRLDFMEKVIESIHKLTVNVELVVLEIKNMSSSIKVHDEAIEDIKDNMETKDTVLKLYEKIEDSKLEHKQGMDAIMKEVRKTNEALDEHKQEPAKGALAREKSLKKWLVGAVGAIIASQYIPEILQLIFTK